MTDYRKLAQGKPCQVRIPHMCDGGGETTVLAHYRMAGFCGTGMKPDDVAFGAWCCGPCHDVIDGRRKYDWSWEEIKLAHSEGVQRTVAQLRYAGILK